MNALIYQMVLESHFIIFSIYSCWKIFAGVETLRGPPSVALLTTHTAEVGDTRVPTSQQLKNNPWWGVSPGRIKAKRANSKIWSKATGVRRSRHEAAVGIFDLGWSFQRGLTSRDHEESRADSLRRWFQWYSIYKAHGSGSAATDGAVRSTLNYFSQHLWK